MEAKKDSAGHTYFDVANIRVTALAQTWDDDKPGLRIQAYREEGKNTLHNGAEIPVPDKIVAYDLIEAIVQALHY